MSLDIAVQGEGYVIGNFFCFGGEKEEGQLVLAREMGPAMQYQGTPREKIDFPGEYEVGGFFINVYEGKMGKLNYIVRGSNESRGLIQDAKILDEDAVKNVDNRLYEEEGVFKKLESMEYEGEYNDLLALRAAA